MPIDPTTLPVNIDSLYPDRSSGDALHQQHHDTIHAVINAITTDPEALRAIAIAVLDVGDYFDGTDLEAVLQEVGLALQSSGGGGGGLGMSGRWQANTNAGAIPGGQQVTTSSGTSHDLTYIRFADHDQSNMDFTQLLLDLEVGAKFYAQMTSDASRRAIYEVTGLPVDQGSYIEVPCTTISFVGSGAAWQTITVVF